MLNFLKGDTVKCLHINARDLRHQAMVTVNRQLQLSMQRAEKALDSMTARDLYSAVDGSPHPSLKMIGMAVSVLLGLGNGEELAMWDEFKFLVGVSDASNWLLFSEHAMYA